MSIDDAFYSNDRSLLGRLDTAMIKAAGKMAADYQKDLGKHYTELIKFNYRAAGVISAIGLVPPLIGSWFKVNEFEIESPREEEQRLEKEGQSIKKGKLERAVYLFSPLFFEIAAQFILTDEMHRQYRILAWPLVGATIGMLPYAFAEYLCKARVPAIEKSK